MFTRTLIAAMIGLGSIAPLPAAAQSTTIQSTTPQEIDLSQFKCEEFLKGDPETSKTIMFWLAGYYTYEDDPTIISLGKLKDKEQQIRLYCSDNPDTSLISASEIFMDKKYNN